MTIKTIYKTCLSLLIVLLYFGQCAYCLSDTLVDKAEAESGVLSGGVSVANTTAGYSGTGYVTNFRNAPDKVTVTMNVPVKAYYRLVIRYSAPYGAKNEKVYANNGGASSVVFNTISTFADADAGKYLLEAGINTITLQSDWGWIDIDKFTIYSVTQQNNVYDFVTDLVNPDANQQAKDLYNYLLSKFNKKIISGQTNDWYDKIKPIAGKSPLLRAFDFQHYTQGYSYLWNNSVGGFTFGAEDDGQIQTAINWYNSTNKNGLVNFHWHWHSPFGGSVGTNTFYTDQTTFDVTKAVTPGTPENIKILQDIDTISYQLKRLQDAGVPVLWRPLHEAGGGWFWWGAKGATACKQLYAIMYDRMTNYHHLNNLIWIWSTPESDWYPGNETVDIVGHDSYPGAYIYDAKKNDFDILYNLTGGKKLITMSENGPIPNPDDCLVLDAPWSWFMSWSDLVASQNTNQHIIDVFNNPNVLTLENPSSVSEDQKDNLSEYKVYPNPACDMLNISGADYSRLELIDTNGKIVYSSEFPVEVIQTKNFSEGIYLLRIYNNQKMNQVKVIFGR